MNNHVPSNIVRASAVALMMASVLTTGATQVAAQSAHPAVADDPYRPDWPATAKIDNALSAMPAFMHGDATVWDWETNEDGTFVVLKEGNSDWTCFPDRVATPSNDPMCHDPIFLEWMLANATGGTPTIERAGLSYMLQGGSAFTQDSPFISGPFDDPSWYYMGPHVMVVLPDGADWSGVSRDTASGAPVIEALGLAHPILLFPVAAPDEVIETRLLPSDGDGG